MSLPVSYCLLVKAIDNDEAFQRILPIMIRNLKHGAFTVAGCKHKPMCREMDEDEWPKLLARFKKGE